MSIVFFLHLKTVSRTVMRYWKTNKLKYFPNLFPNDSCHNLIAHYFDAYIHLTSTRSLRLEFFEADCIYCYRSFVINITTVEITYWLADSGKISLYG